MIRDGLKSKALSLEVFILYLKICYLM